LNEGEALLKTVSGARLTSVSAVRARLLNFGVRWKGCAPDSRLAWNLQRRNRNQIWNERL